jgi:hypothetical protein
MVGAGGAVGVSEPAPAELAKIKTTAMITKIDSGLYNFIFYSSAESQLFIYFANWVTVNCTPSMIIFPVLLLVVWFGATT